MWMAEGWRCCFDSQGDGDTVLCGYPILQVDSGRDVCHGSSTRHVGAVRDQGSRTSSKRRLHLMKRGKNHPDVEPCHRRGMISTSVQV